jgi:hypothetical protein
MAKVADGPEAQEASRLHAWPLSPGRPDVRHLDASQRGHPFGHTLQIDPPATEGFAPGALLLRRRQDALHEIRIPEDTFVALAVHRLPPREVLGTRPPRKTAEQPAPGELRPPAPGDARCDEILVTAAGLGRGLPETLEHRPAVLPWARVSPKQRTVARVRVPSEGAEVGHQTHAERIQVNVADQPVKYSSSWHTMDLYRF